MPHTLNFAPFTIRWWALAVAGAFAAFAPPAMAQPRNCPLEGDAKQALARALNPFKNRDGAPPVSRFNLAATLTAVLARGNDLHRWSRNDGAIIEGVVVGVKVGGIESVNCHAKDAARRDTHIELASAPSAPPTRRVIVEVTPRWRDKMAVIADWSTAALKKQLLGRRVRITGWLFDDLEHQRQAENTNPGAAADWRASVWEIHPVTGIQVLSAAAGTPSVPTTTSHVAAHRRAARKTCGRSRTHACRTSAHIKPPRRTK